MRATDDYDVAEKSFSFAHALAYDLLNEEIVNKAKLSVRKIVFVAHGDSFHFFSLLLSEKSLSMRPMLKYAIENFSECFR